MAYSYKTSINFGLVYIPVTLHSAIKNNDISFKLLDKKTLSKVKYKKTCVDCDNKELKNSDIVKGYEYEKNKFVVLNDEDFDKIKSKKDKSISIECFVSLKDIDPIYFDRPYFVSPIGAERPFTLLLNAMEKENKCAIAKTVLGTKETLIALRSKNGQMILNTLFFYEELQPSPVKKLEVEKDAKFQKEMKMATSLIESMTEKFEPKNYVDEYQNKLRNAIEKKISGKKITKSKETSSPKINDLMDALKKSLELKKRGKDVPDTPSKTTKQTIKKTTKKTKSSARANEHN